MDQAATSIGLAASSKRFARRLLTIGENRLGPLTVEVQAERKSSEKATAQPTRGLPM